MQASGIYLEVVRVRLSIWISFWGDWIVFTDF